MINWLQFAIAAIIIIFAGRILTGSAKTIAEQTGIGTAWAGMLMLPLVTSLPELVTSLRAVLIDAPDLALGNIFGSNLFNLALLAVADLVHGRGALTARVNQGHILTASLVVVVVSIAALAMISRSTVQIGWVGLDTIVIALIYFAGSRLLFKYEKKNIPALEVSAGEGRTKSSATGPAFASYLLAAGLIIVSGVLITDAADRIALETGLGRTFVGSLLLAVSTSLPEAVTVISAVRLGVLDMAVANIFGANLMNMLILFWADLFYRPAPILSVVSGINSFSAIIVIMLTMVIIFGLVYRSQRELIRIGYDSLIVVIGYLSAIYMIFKLSSG